MVYSLKLKYLLVILPLVFGTLTSLAQREKNYIYLFDCTGSMHTNGLWNAAQFALDKNIALRTAIPGSCFTVIPFGDKPYGIFSFINTNYLNKKTDIFNSFDTCVKKAKFTNITDVLNSGFKQIDSNKDNEIYLFTDGIPNGVDSPEKVAKTIGAWCVDHRNVKLFYVALTNGVINPEIKQAIDACPDASIVQCEDGIVPVITDISNDVYTNLEELANVIEMSFSVPGNYNLTSYSSDKLFDFSIVDAKVSNGKIRVKISPKKNLSIDELHQVLQGNDYEFQAIIQCADKHYVIANPTVNIHVSDEVPVKLTIAKGVGELKAKDVEWYDTFLWSAAAPDDTVVWNLMPVFKNEFQNSRLTIKFQAGEGQSNNDFQAWFNKQPISDGSTIKIVPDQPAVLEVLFTHNATTGKRYFSLIPISITGLDFINEQPSDNYKGTSLRTNYSIYWNPLKMLLLWLAIVLISCLLLWFVVFKRIFFPAIKISRVVFIGPDSYFVSKRIKGARKVVLSSKRKTQNIFSRIFTGEIRYIKADHFSPELSIVPIGAKKKVKLRSDGDTVNSWDIYPSSIFSQYDEGIIKNRTTTKQSKIEFN